MRCAHSFLVRRSSQTLGVTHVMFPGTDGYGEQAEDLIPRYEAVEFTHKYRAELHLLPTSPVRILDIGAGSGADAAWLAERGHSVLAVEPTLRLREAGIRLHPSRAIEWVDDGLPELKSVVERNQHYDLILLCAVWMHLDRAEREVAMPVVVRLLGAGGLILMSLRHGCVPGGRRMFKVSAAETIELAKASGLATLLCKRVEASQPVNRQAGVTWTRLAFRALNDANGTPNPSIERTCHGKPGHAAHVER